MRQHILQHCSRKIGLAVCDKNPSKTWTLIDHGLIEYSEKQPGEFNIKAILAPRDGKDQLLQSISVPLPVLETPWS